MLGSSFYVFFSFVVIRMMTCSVQSPFKHGVERRWGALTPNLEVPGQLMTSGVGEPTFFNGVAPGRLTLLQDGPTPNSIWMVLIGVCGLLK